MALATGTDSAMESSARSAPSTFAKGVRTPETSHVAI
jgi:hypothetical protein